MELLKLDKVSFAYGDHKVLNDIEYSFEEGKIYAITGKSGVGKTTLLSLISGMAEPTSGTIYCKDKDIKTVDKYQYRSNDIGVIFQDFNLLTKLTAVENVQLSMDISNAEIEDKEKRAYEVLETVGLSKDESDRRVLKLSGGQRQRVAIARALSYNPEIILADEPTGNLDEETQTEIMNIMRKLADDGKCIIIVTHSSYVAKQADVQFRLESAQMS